jgi:CheY-like chemotaxis protein
MEVPSVESLPEKKAIVIVEDNEQIAELIKDTLNAEPDYQAVAVNDGALALEVIRSVKASLILMDIKLPGLDGLQLYDVLQANEATRHIPVIFLTANYDSSEFQKRRIKQYIAKPFDLDELLTRVGEVCRANDS